jgi:hypothetical protein
MKFDDIYKSITEQTLMSVPKTGVGEIDTITNVLLNNPEVRRLFGARIDVIVTVLQDPRFIDAYKKTNPNFKKPVMNPNLNKPSEADLNARMEADRQSREGFPSATDLMKEQ